MPKVSADNKGMLTLLKQGSGIRMTQGVEVEITMTQGSDSSLEGQRQTARAKWESLCDRNAKHISIRVRR